jgi:hypothetical protein
MDKAEEDNHRKRPASGSADDEDEDESSTTSSSRAPVNQERNATTLPTEVVAATADHTVRSPREMERLTRRRERHATQSRRKRVEIQHRIDTLRQDCGRLNTANLHTWHHNNNVCRYCMKSDSWCSIFQWDQR